MEVPFNNAMVLMKSREEASKVMAAEFWSALTTAAEPATLSPSPAVLVTVIPPSLTSTPPVFTIMPPVSTSTPPAVTWMPPAMTARPMKGWGWGGRQSIRNHSLDEELLYAVSFGVSEFASPINNITFCAPKTQTPY